MTISYTIVDCVLGRMIVGRTAKGVCSVAFADDDLMLIENLRNEFPKAEIALDDMALTTYVE